MNMFLRDLKQGSCDLKQNILQVYTQKQLNYNVACIRSSDIPKTDVTLTSLNLTFK